MIKFGPSGNSEAYNEAKHVGSEYSAKWVKEHGLDCFEYSFGRGVNLSREKAIEIGESFEKEGIELSVHAPYFINLATPEEEKADNSFRYIIDSMQAAKLMKATRVVFHPAAQGKASFEEATQKTIERIKILESIIPNDLFDIKLCPETMGKSAQIGDVKEIIEFCKLGSNLYPCVDFGHVNSRRGGTLKTKQDFLDILNEIEDGLGFDKLDNMHVHFSKIMYGPKGEIKHLTFEDNVYGPNFEPFIEAVKEKGINPYIVSESAGTQDIDSLLMKEYYNKI